MEKTKKLFKTLKAEAMGFDDKLDTWNEKNRTEPTQVLGGLGLDQGKPQDYQLIQECFRQEGRSKSSNFWLQHKY